MTNEPVLYLTVGLPGAGKTTLARQIADTEAALRLTPDEWMAPLFRDSDADGRRDVLEGRLIWVAHEVLRSGASVILDFGCWSPDERYAIRVIAESVGARFDLRHVVVDGSLPASFARGAVVRSRARCSTRVRQLVPLGERSLAVTAALRRGRADGLTCRSRAALARLFRHVE